MSTAVVHIHPMTDTHVLLHDFEYVEPASLDDAVWWLNEFQGRARLLAGGTYLLVQMKMERQAPQCLINVRRVPGLEGISLRDVGLHIGACTSIYSISLAHRVWTDYTALQEACASFGSTQIQMMGTLGGNLCNGSPASDTVPALLALDAQLQIAGPRGARTMSVEEFLVGPGETALQEGEVLTGVVLPALRPGAGSAFKKLSRVAADLAKVSVAAALARDGERVVDCHLALGSVGPTVVRAKRAEALLIGRRFSTELALEAGSLVAEEIQPIDDVRSTAWYRCEAAKAVTHDALVQAWARAGEAPGAPGAARARKMHGVDVVQRPKRMLRLGPHERHLIDLTVNGQEHRLWVAANELLLNVLREKLALTGTKYGCGIGECGACTVQINGAPALACLTLAVAADGSEVSTIEGMQSADGTLHPLQEAFIEHQAFQCGYCTPGMLMMSGSLLEELPSPTEDDVRAYLRGNRCRCTGFVSIVRAVLSCAEPAGGPR